MWKPGMPTSDDWVASTAALPIAFAQVREDPRVDRSLAEELGRKARVLMIASGGETAALLATLPIESLHLVDAAAAQVGLTKLKLAMLTDTSTENRLKLLGHYAMDANERGDELQRRMSELGIAANEFGDPDLVAEFGPDFCARYEWVFARLRECLLPHQHAIRHLLSLSHAEEQAKHVAGDTELGQGLEQAFDSVMELSNLVAIFGPDATANRAQPFSKHFFDRTKKALSRFPASENPFLHQMLFGTLCRPPVGLARFASAVGIVFGSLPSRHDARSHYHAARSKLRPDSPVQHPRLDQTATGGIAARPCLPLLVSRRDGCDPAAEFGARHSRCSIRVCLAAGPCQQTAPH